MFHVGEVCLRKWDAYATSMTIQNFIFPITPIYYKATRPEQKTQTLINSQQ